MAPASARRPSAEGPKSRGGTSGGGADAGWSSGAGASGGEASRGGSPGDDGGDEQSVFGPLRIMRAVKDDGRALIIYSHEEP
jgi:hypothetical protein